MRIGFVLDDSLDKADGVQQYVLTLGRWLRSRGHEVHYLVGQTERTDIPHVHSLSRNLQVHFNQNRMSTPLPAHMSRLRRLLAEHDYDVLHVQLPFSPFLAGRIIRAASPRTAVIGTFHIIPFSGLEHMATRLLGVWQRRTLKRFDAICSVSEPARVFARRAFRVESRLLPNPVDVVLYRSAKPLKHYQDGRLNILFLGRLVERKGCLHFLAAIQRLHEQGELTGVRVLVAGKGPLESALKRYVKENHLGAHVHFLGFVAEKDKPAILNAAHISVFPSTGGESFGIVLIEAMAAGSEVVLAGDNTGYRFVMDGRNEQLIDPTDTTQFARRLRHFLADGKARKRAAAWQHQHVEQFDINLVGSEFVRIYHQALDERRSS